MRIRLFFTRTLSRRLIPRNEFLDFLSSSAILPYILHPTGVTSYSKAFIDNIFSNHKLKEVIYGNLTSAISDHQLQFLIMSSAFFRPLFIQIQYL